MSNVVPVDWGFNPLTDVIEVKHGFQFREEHFSDNGFPVVKIGNLTYGSSVNMKSYSLVPEEKFPNWKSFTIEVGDILMALTGATLGKVSISESLFLTLQNYRVGNFYPKDSSSFHKNYIFWVLQSEFVQGRIEDMVNEAAQPNIGKADLESMSIPVPPMGEQIEITKILNSVREVIEKTQAQIDKLKDLKTGMMQELLTNGIGHIEFKDSPVGKIPAEWEVFHISELMVLNYGKSPKEVIKEKGRNPIWGTGGISNFTDKFLYEGDSILLGRKGTIDKPIFIKGKFWVIDTAYYSSDHGENNVQYLSYKIMMINLKALNEASGVPSLSRDTIYSVRVAMPKLEEQNKVVSIIESINTKISAVELKLSSLKNTKKSLMQDLLAGKVRVKVA